MNSIKIYDTTLRDGSQAEGISFTVEDKIRIAQKLDEMGAHYIEGGWPGSNPRDIDFFSKVNRVNFLQTKIAAFGSTRYPNKKVEEDLVIQALMRTETEVVTIFGKTWDLHVRDALSTSLDENLRMIFESINYLKKHRTEVLFDAEHFFDGYKNNPEYAIKTIKEAESGGADWIVLCDTNGGSLPDEVHSIFSEVKNSIKVRLGIHAHNDSEVAVANSLRAVEAGAQQVQGTINGIGERCGNTNLISIIPNLKIKMGLDCVSSEQLEKLKDVSAFVDELANKAHWNQQPFVGKSAFAHKGGIHVSAVRKNSATYEHIKPEVVGNSQRILISDLSGKSNVLHKAKEFGIDVEAGEPKIQKILKTLKESENLGFQYEGAEASFELLVRRNIPGYAPPFELDDFVIVERHRHEDGSDQSRDMIAEAMLKVRVGDEILHTAAEGNGPINALDIAARKALVSIWTSLDKATLADYKVRILDGHDATASSVRVLIESTDGDRYWTTVGASTDIIEASWLALADALEFAILKND